MNIGVVSDTHDRLDSIQKVYSVFKTNKVDLIIHCGDWVSPFTIEYFTEIFRDFDVPIKSVFGNNEGDIKRIIERNNKLPNPIEFAPKTILCLLIEDRQIAVYHGQDRAILNALIKSEEYDAIFTGHTHKIYNENVGNTLILNPGATCYACESKIIKNASVAIYHLTTNSAEIIMF